MNKSSLDVGNSDEDSDVDDKEAVSFFSQSEQSTKGEIMETDSIISPSKSSVSTLINDESFLIQKEIGPNRTIISEDDCSSDNYEENVLRYLADKLANACGTSGSTGSGNAGTVPASSDLSQTSCSMGLPSDMMTQQKLQQSSLISDTEEENCDSDLYEERVSLYLSQLIAPTEKVEMSESHFVDGIANSADRLSFTERKHVEQACVTIENVKTYDSADDHGAGNMLTSTPNSRCNIINVNNDSRLVGVTSLADVEIEKVITISSPEKDFIVDVCDGRYGPVRDEGQYSPVLPPLHITISSSPPVLESDVEDSDEYEEMVRKYLMNSYSVPNSNDKEVLQNDAACGINVTDRLEDSSSNSNSDSGSGDSISEKSDFFPEPRVRKKTLYKKRLWKSLESEMLNDLREEKMENKKLKRASNRRDFIVSDESGDDLETETVGSYNRKFSSRKSRVDGIIKICDEFHRSLINTDNKKKVAVYNERESTVPGESLRSDFFKEIQTIHMRTSFRRMNEKALREKDQDQHIGDGLDSGERFVNAVCDICCFKFNNFEQLDRHMVRLHEGIITDICKKCGLSFCNETDFIEHFTEFHGSIMSRISCYLCNRIYDDFDTEFINHLKHEHTFLDLYSFKCKKCNIKFANRFMLNKHLSNDCFFCLICQDYTAKNMQSYRNHLLHHYKVSTYKCKFCDKTFVTQRGCMHHIKNKHTGNLDHTCSICDKKFVTRYKLNEHYYRCHNNKEFTCDVCHKCFKSIYTLNSHKKYHHPVTNEFHCDIDDFTCDSCGINFNRKQSIINHLNVINCKCPLCNLALPCVTKLEEHVEVHRTKISRKLRCTHCCYELNNLQNYKRHLIMLHADICTKENPNAVVCERCKRVCSNRHQLKKHQRIGCMRTEYLLHKGQKNKCDSHSINDDTGICQFCDETFDSSKLKKNHFDIKSTTCFECSCKFVCKTKLNEHVVSVHNQRSAENIGSSFNETRNIDGGDDAEFCKSISERFLNICEDCGNKYLTMNELLLHTKKLCCTNGDELLYECQFCKNRYKTCVALSNHNKTCNRFTCIHCEGIFYLKQAFDLHFLLCNKCIFCGELFECCRLFAIHIKAVHGDQFDNQIMKYDCLDCHNKFSNIFNFIEHFVLVHNFNQNTVKKLRTNFFISIWPKMLRDYSRVNGTNSLNQKLALGQNQCVKTAHEINSVHNTFNLLNSRNDDVNLLIDQISSNENLIRKTNLVISECDSTVLTQ